jgi:uncharacterized protein YrrD
MLRSIEKLKDFRVQAVDGELGSVSALLFDERRWHVRYLVMDVGNWLVGRQVLISPTAVTEIDNETKDLFLSLTKEQIENSPDVAEDAPVSREIEQALHKYYQWRPYWGIGVNDPLAFSPFLGEAVATEIETKQDESQVDVNVENHLRSTAEVTGYQIQARDGEIGHVNDFLFDDKEWRIRHLVVDTGTWLPGKKVLLAPPWIQRIQWAAKKVYFALTQDSVRHSPPFDPVLLDTEQYEKEMLDQYQAWFSYLLKKEQGELDMFLGKDIMGNPVVTVSNGRSIGKVKDIYLAPDCQSVVGIYLGTEGLFSRQSFLVQSEDIVTIGEDVVLVKHEEVIEEVESLSETESAWLRRDELQGRRVDTPGGTKVGKVGDVMINRNGDVLGFSLSHVYVAGPIAENHAIAMHTVQDVGDEDGIMTIDLKRAEQQELSVA